MNAIRKSLVWGMFILVICSCTKSPLTTVSEWEGTLLAGPRGASKNWMLTAVTVSVNGAAAYLVSGIPICESDNVFTFSNNSAQDYVQTEGASFCASTDPTTLEKGSWGITDDGKNLLIAASYYPTTEQFTAEQDLPLFILSQGEPLQLMEITASRFKIAYSYQDKSLSPAPAYSFTLTFTAQ